MNIGGYPNRRFSWAIVFINIVGLSFILSMRGSLSGRRFGPDLRVP